MSDIGADGDVSLEGHSLTAAKQTFRFYGLCSEIRPAKFTNHSARTNREIYR